MVNNKMVAELAVRRCGGDRKKARQELELHREKRSFYEKLILEIQNIQKPLDDLFEALIEEDACIDALLEAIG